MIKKQRLKGLIYILPALFIYSFVIGIPSLFTFGLSLTKWSGTNIPQFIGFENFITMFSKAEWVVRIAIKNNLIWMVLMLFVNVTIGIVVAGLMQSIQPFMLRLYRLIFFLPVILPRTVVARLFMWLYNPFVGLNSILDKWGLSIQGLGDPNTVIYYIAIVGIWCWWGFPLVIFLSSLQQIDPTFYEAAKIDGANRPQMFIYLTIPLLKPTLIFLIILTTILSFQIFDLNYIMTWGGPGRASEVLGTLIYKNGILEFNEGYASALAVFQILLSSVAIWAYIYIQKRGLEV